MADTKFRPVKHDHEEFIAKAKKRMGFEEAYAASELEYSLIKQMLKARAKAGLTQDNVAEIMGISKSAVSRLEAGRRHAPSVAALQKYAVAVGCELQIKMVRRKLA